tara:strand:- start:1822 stop:2976 length:1155 start_codon:yes stop_codon:yes gene_type:complete
MPVINYESLDTTTDVTTTRTLLHEVIPITGAIISGGAGDGALATYNNENIKNYTHGMFQSVYDYPYLSSSSNHIFDITMGYDESSAFSSSAATQNSKKINLYNQFSQLLLGYTGSDNTVRLFESDLTLDQTGSMTSCFFLSFSRLLVKDQIKKGSFSIKIGTGSWGQPWPTGSANAPSAMLTLQDLSASVNGEGTTNVVGGDYGLLYDTTASLTSRALGVIFYQAGVVVLTSSIFDDMAAETNNHPGISPAGTHGHYFLSGSPQDGEPHVRSVSGAFTGSVISASCDALRHRIYNVSFNNSTEINSTIYFCRVPHNKYNYSSNPTYLSSSQIRVKSIASDEPVSYITTIGLYNSSNELLATAKLSEPLKKTPTNEITLRVRLDY